MVAVREKMVHLDYVVTFGSSTIKLFQIDILMEISGNKYLSISDQSNTYHQLKIILECRKFTAFITP